MRVVTPRFLTEGDEVVMPTIVHNYRPDTRTASLNVQVTGLDVGRRRRDQRQRRVAGQRRRAARRLALPAATAPGTATITATAKTETDTDAVELPIPVLPYRTASRGRRQRLDRRRGRSAPPRSRCPRRPNAAARTVARRAGAVAGRLDARRARLPHRLSVRLHRADALELPAQPARHARAHRAEAGAHRTPAARSIARSRPASTASSTCSTTMAGGGGGRRTGTIRS